MEEIIKALLLGIIQGVTEFLPVSSSGHLVILQELLDFQGPRLLFDLVIHLATLLCVVIYFRQDIFKILNSFKKDSSPENKENRLLIIGIILASIPTALIGLFIKRYEDILFHSLVFASSMLIVSGIILLLSSLRSVEKEKSYHKFSLKSLLVGIAQGLSVLPGISRSGTTITTAILSGIDKKTAFRFSFLASIPAILGALLLKTKDLGQLSLEQGYIFIVGFVSAFIFGYFSLKLLDKLVNKGKLTYFAPYCFLLALVALLFNYLG